MRKNKRKKKRSVIKALGEHINKIIIQKGFKSPYDFWIQALGEDVSRASLNYILKGSVDVKATTLKKIADALEIDAQEILNFKMRVNVNHPNHQQFRFFLLS